MKVSSPTSALPVVYLARHATPDWTRTDIRYDIPPGPPLTAQGEAEASRLGEYLAANGVVRIHCSPLQRARHTAQIAANLAGVPLVESSAIAEWRRDESQAVMGERVRIFWETINEESRHVGPIAIVTHGGPILALLEHLQVDAAELTHFRNQFDHRNPAPPAGAWLTTRDRFDSQWQARLVFTPSQIQPFAPTVAYV